MVPGSRSRTGLQDQSKTLTKTKDHYLSRCLRDPAKIWNHDKIELLEEFKVLLLNRNNKVLGVLDASSGGITGTVADPRIILTAAIKANAVGIVLLTIILQEV